MAESLERNKALVRQLIDRGFNRGERGSFRAFFIWRVANGRLAESWGVADRFDFLQQLGIIPSDDELAARMPGPQGSD